MRGSDVLLASVAMAGVEALLSLIWFSARVWTRRARVAWLVTSCWSKSSLLTGVAVVAASKSSLGGRLSLAEASISAAVLRVTLVGLVGLSGMLDVGFLVAEDGDCGAEA